MNRSAGRKKKETQRNFSPICLSFCSSNPILPDCRKDQLFCCRHRIQKAVHHKFRSSDNRLQFLPGRLMLIMQCANGRSISHYASFPPAHPFQNVHFIIHICFGIERFRMRFQVTLGKNHTGTMQNYVFCRNRYINTLFRSSAPLYMFPEQRTVFLSTA